MKLTIVPLLFGTGALAADRSTLRKLKGSKASASGDGSDSSSTSSATGNPGCIQRSQMIATIGAFAGAVPGISKAYRQAGGGPAKSATKAGCQAAYDTATAALAAAYGYDSKVLFKPTYSAEPYTYRTTVQGALSYFIGTECLTMVGKPSDQFPPGNDDGSMFYEYGFALNNYNGNGGWKEPTEWDPAKFFYRDSPNGGQNCDTAVAMGRMCFTYGNEAKGQACVDKTFGFNDLTGEGPVLTTHHSSALITKEGSPLLVCQSGWEGHEC